MKLPWNKDDEAVQSGVDVADPANVDIDHDFLDETEVSRVKGSPYTEGKGRPTPKRREAQARRRGPVAPPPTNRAEARARKKQLQSTMTKTEKKELNAERRALRMEQREKMMAGEERYLMPRDKGPVRRYVRDLVDSRRNFAGLFMPFAIVLIMVMFLPQIAAYANLVLLVFVVCMIIDSVLLGRLVNRRVRERFPDTSDGGFKLGWYAFTRAMQLRPMRAPKPQVSAGAAV